MRIQVVNPNTTDSMTATIGACARAVAGPGTRIEAVTSPMGPASIESHYDEALSVPGLLSVIAAGEASAPPGDAPGGGVDGYVIACFGDPGLDAARELARGPVVGIAEAAFHTAALLGRGFSVVTTLSRTIGRAADLVSHYGFARQCRGIHACEIPVLELETDPAARAVITAACADALAADSSDVIVLGCAGMADLCSSISEKIGAPVVDGVAAGTLLVQSLVSLGLRTGTTGGGGEFEAPRPKAYTGLLRPFSR